MANKTTSGVLVNKMQKELEIEQKKSLGMNVDGDGSIDNAVIVFENKVEKTLENTYKQNGRIEAQKSALDKKSSSHNKYNNHLKKNNDYIEKVKC